MNRYNQTPNAQAALTNSLKTLINVGNSAEGSNLPPPQHGPFRVPFVTNLQVSQTKPLVGGVQFTLTFNEPANPQATIDHYNIYASGINGDPKPQNVGETQLSPGVVFITTTVPSVITFTVQTVLNNGMNSDLASSPTCTGMTPAPIITAPFLNFGSILLGPNATLSLNIVFVNNSPGAGSISWSGDVAYKGKDYTITAGNTSDFYIIWQLSSPNVFTFANSIPILGADAFIVAGNNGGLFQPVTYLSDGTNATYISPTAFSTVIAGGLQVFIGHDGTDGGVIQVYNPASTHGWTLTGAGGLASF